MKTLREYCITIEDSSKVAQLILEKDATTNDRIWALIYDLHFKSGIIAPESLPFIYGVFVVVLVIALLVTLFVLFRESKAIFAMLIEVYKKRLEYKSGVRNGN